MQFLDFENGLKFLRSLQGTEGVESNAAAWVFAEKRMPGIDLAPEKQPSLAGRKLRQIEHQHSLLNSIDHWLPSNWNARESGICMCSKQNSSDTYQRNTELLHQKRNLISDVKGIRPRVQEICYVWSYFGFDLAKRLGSVAYPAESVISGTEGYIQTSFEFSIQYPFEWLINLARGLNSHICDDHEHRIKYSPSLQETASPFVDVAVPQKHAL